MALAAHDTENRRKPTWSYRLRARIAVFAALFVARLSPHRIQMVLHLVSRGARPATMREAKAAREAVVFVSVVAAGTYGCLVRSIGTALLCRSAGVWPTWCVGVRTEPPFGAHAWLEAEGQMVAELGSMASYRRLITVAGRVRVSREQKDS